LSGVGVDRVENGSQVRRGSSVEREAVDERYDLHHLTLHNNDP
jgi:hypothetical protein